MSNTKVVLVATSILACVLVACTLLGEPDRAKSPSYSLPPAPSHKIAIRGKVETISFKDFSETLAENDLRYTDFFELPDGYSSAPQWSCRCDRSLPGEYRVKIGGRVADLICEECFVDALVLNGIPEATARTKMAKFSNRRR